LVIVVLITGMIGCGGGESYTLTIASTAGGSVTTPGEGTFTYDEGTVVNLTATPNSGYHFVNWTGNVSTIADVSAAATAITMQGDYKITANFNEQAAHRIGVRVVDGGGEFYDRMTGQKFIPRGNNYIRLADQAAWGEPGILYHSNFNQGLYNSTRDEQALAKMEQDGYNVVRVWINHLAVVNSSGNLSTEYLRNVTDFLERAKEKNIYVMLTIDYPPGPGYVYPNIPFYWDIEGENLKFLTREYIEVEQRFWCDFILGLIDQEAPLDAIFAYELQNEAFFVSNLKPLSLTFGIVETGNGQTYDMSKPEDKQRMMDENLVYWIDQVRAAVLEVDPTALVTVGFFWPQEPNPARIGDPRVIHTRPAIWESSADFIDLHLYPGLELTMAQYVGNYEIDGFTLKPIIMGEYGAFRDAFLSIDGASHALHDWQVESCQYDFDGWLLWTWDTDEQPELWNGLSDGEVINQALAPKNRPDPCTP
jgi:hypothetical protein